MMTRSQESRMLQVDADMWRAGINVNDISKVSKMRQLQSDKWVTVYLYHPDYPKRFMGTDTMDTTKPHREEIQMVQDRSERRFGVVCSISHEKL